MCGSDIRVGPCSCRTHRFENWGEDSDEVRCSRAGKVIRVTCSCDGGFSVAVFLTPWLGCCRFVLDLGSIRGGAPGRTRGLRICAAEELSDSELGFLG